MEIRTQIINGMRYVCVDDLEKLFNTKNILTGFNKKKFSEILRKIVNLYKNSTEFSEISGTGRSYISKYINLSFDKAPSPKILKKIAENSKGITSYEELMDVCGYLDGIN